MPETNLVKLSRIDELSMRKYAIEQADKEAKEKLKDKVMLALAGALTDDAEQKVSGLTVFYERWIRDLDRQIRKEIHKKNVPD